MTVRPVVVPVVHQGPSPYAPLTSEQVAANLRPVASGVHVSRPKESQ